MFFISDECEETTEYKKCDISIGLRNYNYGKSSTVYSRVCPLCEKSDFNTFTKDGGTHQHCLHCNRWMKMVKHTTYSNECTHCGSHHTYPYTNDGGSISLCRQCGTMFNADKEKAFVVTLLDPIDS